MRGIDHKTQKPVRPRVGRIGLFIVGVLAYLLTDGLSRAESVLLTVEPVQFLTQLQQSYEAVSNVTVLVHRKYPGGAKGSDMISRVIWARGNCMNVQTLSPERRRVLIDGKNVYIQGAKDKKPSVKPLSEQGKAQAAQLSSVPGTPLELLSTLDGATGCEVTAEGAARALCFTLLPREGAEETAQPTAVVVLDDSGAISAIRVYADDTRRLLVSEYLWKGAYEALPGVFLYRSFETILHAKDGGTIQMTTSFERLRVNAGFQAAVFNPNAFF